MTSQTRATAQAENDLNMLIELVVFRENGEVTVEEIAEKMGVSVDWVYEFERCDGDPRMSTVRQYANCVGAMIEHHVKDGGE